MHLLQNYIVLDLETTGLSPEEGDRIIEVAAVRVEGGKVVAEYSTCVNPEVELRPVIMAITGITQEDVDGAPLWEEVLPQVVEFMGDLPIVGHNIGFDINFLRHYGCPMEGRPSVDTFVLATMLLPVQESYALEILSHAHGLTQGTHRALDDVKASQELLALMQQEYTQMSEDCRYSIAALMHRSAHPYQCWFAKPPTSGWNTHWYMEYTPQWTHTVYPPVQTISSELEDAWARGGLQILELPLGAQALPHILGDKRRCAVAFQSEYKVQQALAQWSVGEGTGRTAVCFRPRSSFMQLERFTVLLMKEHYTNQEVTAYAKILMAMGRGTFDGTASSIKLTYDDSACWALLALGEGETAPWYTLYEDALANASVVCTTHTWGAAHPTEHGVEVMHILHGQHLAKSVSYAVKEEWTLERFLSYAQWIGMCAPWIEDWQPEDLERLQSKLEIMYGLWGMWVNKVGAAEQQFNRIAMEPHLLSTPSYQEVLHALEHIRECVQGYVERIHGVGTVLIPVLQAQLDEFTQMVAVCAKETYDGERHVRLLGDRGVALGYFAKNGMISLAAWAAQHSVCCYTSGGALQHTPRGDVWRIIPQVLGMPQPFHPLGIAAPSAKSVLIIPTDLPDPNNPTYFRECSKLLVSIATYFGGQVVGAFASNHVLERLFTYVYPLLKAQGIHVLVEGMSGSLGKLLYQYRAREERSVLLGSNMVLEKIPMQDVHIRAAIIQKLPFGMVPQGVGLDSGSSGFREYGLPAMLMQLRGMMSHVVQHAHYPTVCFLWDTRIINAGYGREVLASLEQDMEVHMVPMKEIKELLDRVTK